MLKPISIAVVCVLSLLAAASLLSNESADVRQVSTSIEDSGKTEVLATLLLSRDANDIKSAIDELSDDWQPAYIPMLLETMTYTGSTTTLSAIQNLLVEETGEDFGYDRNAWFQWSWNQTAEFTADYADFKASLYEKIDPKFGPYFRGRQESARIRLDEIRWGGVVQDGIPPLRNPEMLAAKSASYLEDDNIVFGIEINGDARAYPKRILAWHEMFVDTVGGVDIAGVYCTLCGTVIPYKTTFNGVPHKLGTSGFLYRSNKLMYDAATQSMWNTITGEPVLGPLVDKGIALEHLSVVTTTWGEWKRRHPDTQVLSLKTGHSRDYGEGVAYQEYFATDQLMFNTPFNDDRLKNKQEVLALRFPAAPSQQLAIDTDFLNKNPIYTDKIGTQKLLVLTDGSGANRVYDPKGITVVDYDRDSTVTDSNGAKWRLDEASLTAEDGRQLERLPYHRAFWFGWRAAYPKTRLVM